MSTTARGLACVFAIAGLATGMADAAGQKAKPRRAKAPATASTVRGHRLLLGGTELRRVYILGADGNVEWSYPATGPVCDLAQRENGNVLFADRNKAQEITPDKTVLWEHKAAKGEEIFTCQPLPDGKVMILCCGTPPRIMEFDAKTGAVEKSLTVPTTTKKVHGQFRVGRKTSKGTYLLPYLSENKVCELDADGKVIRTIANIRGPFQAELLQNGNILIGGGYGKQVVEIAPDDSVVWKLGAAELPGEPFKFIAGIQRLANGNTMVVNWAGHVPHAPTAQMLEVTPGKKIVWKFNDWDSFSALSSVQVLDRNEE
jgi:hypothetical protein